MQRTTIAVVLMLLPSSSALGCYDEHNSGWINEMPARSWERLAASEERNSWEEMSRLWVFAAGAGRWR